MSKKHIWAGRILGGLPALFLILNSAISLTKPPFVVEGTLKMGYSEATIIPLGLAAILSTLLYLIPRTSVLGAVLLTGYFGGAVATHVRAGDPAPLIAVPILFSITFWFALWLRHPNLRRLLPLTSDNTL
ncbi:MAG: DoxX family protein [Bryobacterales bacterium]|nr:DoxX family protein [Bryobacterales bacterium]